MILVGGVRHDENKRRHKISSPDGDKTNEPSQHVHWQGVEFANDVSRTEWWCGIPTTDAIYDEPYRNNNAVLIFCCKKFGLKSWHLKIVCGETEKHVPDPLLGLAYWSRNHEIQTIGLASVLEHTGRPTKIADRTTWIDMQLTIKAELSLFRP